MGSLILLLLYFRIVRTLFAYISIASIQQISVATVSVSQLVLDCHQMATGVPEFSQQDYT